MLLGFFRQISLADGESFGMLLNRFFKKGRVLAFSGLSADAEVSGMFLRLSMMSLMEIQAESGAVFVLLKKRWYVKQRNGSVKSHKFLIKWTYIKNCLS
jgi:hypothetical protein